MCVGGGVWLMTPETALPVTWCVVSLTSHKETTKKNLIFY